MKQGLILVDIQNDYFKGGKYELVNPEQAAMQANKILTFFRREGWPIYHVRHISTNPGAGFFIPDTEGADFYRACCPLEGEEIIIKHRPDSFLRTTLKEKLEETGVAALVVCGMMTHMCIDSTVRTAGNYGYAVTLIEDACATRDLVWGGIPVLADQVRNAYMAALDGTFARVVQADVWIKEN
ncbi:isochorismatase hydrolase [Syntrophobotulus glycolicus DSM 8271]|uniref:Isochorismatase hydrolase n=1 Tax=Syntrophobotulus glycolicus (strain DSM 8271 / FlGlyR) TaxID=645991 RepID=F0SUI3_SYNGF|nr:cysteine hydrolase family protein [Syntrophobotulus glycolicus]ADY55476.1 isochorismatase hydrolase [Syntrophobotulus glycolicus DSM 8271]